MSFSRHADYSRVLGMNARTQYVDNENPPHAIRGVNNKYNTKQVLQTVGVPTVPTLAIVRDRRDLESLDWDALPDAWALKPNNGRQGAGIMLARERAGSGWRTSSGRELDRRAITDHVRTILEGEYSMESLERDWALFEPLIVADPALAGLSDSGLPDIRVICYRCEPVLAMMRLPTKASGGRANLHQGAAGAGIDLASGVITRAVCGREEITNHPDTGAPIIGVQVPHWDKVVTAATNAGKPIGLGYLGADIVICALRGPVVMELNGRPGLEIQNVTGEGLVDRLRSVIERGSSCAGTGWPSDF